MPQADSWALTQFQWSDDVKAHKPLFCSIVWFKCLWVFGACYPIFVVGSSAAACLVMCQVECETSLTLL